MWGGAAYRDRTDDLRITRGMLPARARATCTDSTDHRTDGTHDAGIIGTPFHEPFHDSLAERALTRTLGAAG
jgi:hypothetical protein